MTNILLQRIVEILERIEGNQTAKQKHCGIGYGGL